MTRCTTLDQAVLEKTKVDKVLQRLNKKGDDEGKKLAQKVLDNAAVVSKQKISDGRSLRTQDSGDKSAQNSTALKSSLDGSRVFDDNASVKRIKDAETTSGQFAKKPINSSAASQGSNTTASSKSIGLLAKRQHSSKTDPKGSVKAGNAAVSAPKVKPNHISAKPSGFFSSLQSASKKPGTSNAALLSAKVKQGKDR